MQRRILPAKLIMLVLATGLVGCASTSGSAAPASTQYKGDAVWNIASMPADRRQTALLAKPT